jgi:hypothetical protein
MIRNGPHKHTPRICVCPAYRYDTAHTYPLLISTYFYKITCKRQAHEVHNNALSFDCLFKCNSVQKILAGLYLRGGFWLDLASTVPFDKLAGLVMTNSFAVKSTRVRCYCCSYQCLHIFIQTSVCTLYTLTAALRD